MLWSLKGENGKKFDLISFDTTIRIKVVTFVYTTKNSNLSSCFYSFHTSQFGSKVHEHYNLTKRCRRTDYLACLWKKIWYSYILLLLLLLYKHKYINHSSLWMNFASKMGKNFVFSLCHAGVGFKWNEGVWRYFEKFFTYYHIYQYFI